MNFNEWLRSIGVEDINEFASKRYYTTCHVCSKDRKKENKKKKCLKVNPETKAIHCFHCGHDESFRNYNDKGNGYFNQKRKFDKVYAKPVCKIVPLPDMIIRWFEDRKIHQGILSKEKITYSQKGKDMFIKFPYFKNGEIVNVKYRKLASKDFYQEKDAEPVVYRYDSVVNEARFLICEGENDVLSWLVAGFDNVCSVPYGAPNEKDKTCDGKLKFLELMIDTFENATAIYISVDADESGRRLERELIRRIGIEKCYKIEYPKGCKDANDVLVKYGVDELKKMYNFAVPYPIEGISRFEDYESEIIERYNHGGHLEVYSTGIDDLDKYFKFKLGEFTIWTGKSNEGKSEFLDQLIINTIKLHEWKWAVFSPENYPPTDYFEKLSSKLLVKPFRRGPTERMTIDELKSAITKLNEYIVLVTPDEDDFKLDIILPIIKACVLRFGITGIVLDPWNELNHQRPNWMTETEYVSVACAKMRRLARKLMLHFNLVAHPTKMWRDKKSGTRPIPTLTDIAGSAHFENKCDCGIIIHRDIMSSVDETNVIVGKVRDQRNVGRPGKCTIPYDRVTGCFLNVNGKQNYRSHHETEKEWELNETDYEPKDKNDGYEINGQQSSVPF